MSHYHNRGSYSDNSSSSHSASNQSENYIPSSRRPDGTYREEIRVRPGFVPEAERQTYVPPAARNSFSSTFNQKSESQEDLDDRVDSWADEEAPVIFEGNRRETVKEAASCESIEKAQEETCTSKVEEPTSSAISVEKVDESHSKTSIAPRGERKPNQLATAIDTTLDSLSIGSPSNSNEASSTRQIGRFATQIANDEREGRTYRHHDNYNDNNSSGFYIRNRDGYNRSYNNWNRNRNSAHGSYSNFVASSSIVKVPTSDAEDPNGTELNSCETRIENEFKSFLERLNGYRREMAVINAKLEYIRYFKLRDVQELSEVEKERIASEGTLVSRMNSIFEALDALSNQ